jgi:uncharacterized RDD family membrane protein YckC
MKKLILLISRIGAYAFDYLLYFGVAFLLGRYGVWGYLASLVLFFLYRYFMTAIMGKTLGMHLLKLILDRYGWTICLKREIARFASAFYFLGYIYAIFEKNGRTFHDIFSDTLVEYEVPNKTIEKTVNTVANATLGKTDAKTVKKQYRIIKAIGCIILVVSIAKWMAGFILNDIGDIGLKRTAISKEYYQSFDGDNLISLSQQELYLRTLGRRYTTIVDIDGKPTLIRLSNKQKYSEIYRMDIVGSAIKGKFLYKSAIPIQYICSGKFRGRDSNSEVVELCGISPQKQIVLIDENGKIFAQAKANISNIISAKSGDIDKDGDAEIILLSRNGEIEIVKYLSGKLKSVFNNKISDDVKVEAFYLNNGITIVSSEDKGSMLYDYFFSKSGFLLNTEKYINITEIGQVEKFDGNILISYIRRNNMTFKVGSIQRFELYENGNTIKRIANFGERPSKGYNFKVRNLEEVVDIDGDGEKELIIKSVNKDDVMGQKYRLEIYKINEFMLKINEILTKIEGIVHWNI